MVANEIDKHEEHGSFFWLKEYQGAKWIYIDFHLHTPGSKTFCCPNGFDRKNSQHISEIIEQYVKKLAEQGIRLAAITDYNILREEWFNPICEKAGKEGVTILPGAELSLESGKYGCHIIAIFSPNRELTSINRAIHALDTNPSVNLVNEDGTHRNIIPRGKLEEALSQIRKQLDAILIIAHPNDSKGLFKTYDAGGAARFIDETKPDAIENLDAQDIVRLKSTGILEEKDFQHIACVEFSDPKTIEEIGSKVRPNGLKRTTYLKLSEINDLNAIRIAFHDPQTRVCIGEAPKQNHTQLLAIKIEGSGFLGSLRLCLSPELNVLIGGRGVGKSAVLESIRYAMDLESYASTDYREGLAKYSLGSGGKISIYLKQFINLSLHRLYRIDRILGDEPRVFELNPENGAEIQEVELSPREIFAIREPPLFFGQREIYEVTRNEEKRLKLLDEIIGREASKKQQDIEVRESELRQNARDLLDLDRKLIEKDDAEHSLKEVRHEIEVYKREGLVEKLKEATRLASDEERLIQSIKRVVDAKQIWQEAQGKIEGTLQGAKKQVEQAQSANKSILADATKEIDLLSTNFGSLSAQGQAYFDQTDKRLAEIRELWKKDRHLKDEEIQKIKQDVGNRNLDPDRLESLSRKQTQLMAKLDDLNALEGDKKEKQDLRKALLKRLRDLRYEVFELRRRQAEDLSKQLRGRVKIQVEYKGQKNGFVNEISAILQGSGVDRASIQKLCVAEDRNIDGIDLAESIRKGASALQDDFALTTAKANKIHSWLTEDERKIFDLEFLAPEDLVQVFLRFDGYEVPLEKLSDGQRATAMLLLLLVQEDRLLIVDQPEDDLDNRFIYEDIVQILRSQKGKRQIIAATHNPNIPVLGDAELIVALESLDGKSRSSVQGAIDRIDVREAVKQIMEGGEDAFRRRAEKYGWITEGE